MSHQHFKDKSVDHHIIEKFVQGVRLSHEPHGVEDPGPGIAAVDSARLSSVLLGCWLMTAGLFQCEFCTLIQYGLTVSLLLAAILAYRAASISWARLERLHRLLHEERYEIENNRDQERQELSALYRLKGFQEPLLSEVVSVLMADSDRLLKVMLEEELGLSLANHRHPLEMALGASVGSLVAGIGVVASYYFIPLPGAWFAISLLCAGFAALHAKFMGNSKLQAFIWSASACSVFLFICGIIFKLIFSQT